MEGTALLGPVDLRKGFRFTGTPVVTEAPVFSGLEDGQAREQAGFKRWPSRPFPVFWRTVQPLETLWREWALRHPESSRIGGTDEMRRGNRDRGTNHRGIVGNS